jgi:hypothetical protein
MFLKLSQIKLPLKLIQIQPSQLTMWTQVLSDTLFALDIADLQKNLYFIL